MANGCWSMDFMSDALMCGRRFRTFNVLDDFNREALAIEIDLSSNLGSTSRSLVTETHQFVAIRHGDSASGKSNPTRAFEMFETSRDNFASRTKLDRKL